MLSVKPPGYGVGAPGVLLLTLLYGLSLPRQPQMIQAKLLKADLHGAIISGNFYDSTWSSGDCYSV